MLHVLTLTWNGLDKLRRLREGLYRNLDTTGIDYTWRIRDNGSTDGTVEEVRTWPKVEMLTINHNRDNFARGMNSLAEMSDNGDLLLFLNNDVEFFDNESLLKMIKLQDKYKASVVGARLLYNKTNKLQHAGVIFGARYGGMPYHYRHQVESDSDAERDRKFQAVTAAVSLMPASIFKKINGFDEKFSWAFDDIDLCLRAGAEGPVIYCGGTNIYHEESASLKKNPVNKLFLNSNVNYFKEKWRNKYELDHERYLKDKNYNVV